MLPYGVVLAVAFGVTALATPIVARVARRAGALDVPEPDDEGRKVHRQPVPTLGGVAIFLGVVAAMAVGSRLEVFTPIFGVTTEPDGILAGVLLIALLGVVDDYRGVPAPVKLAGQIVAALVTVYGGIQIVYLWFPGLGVISLSADIGIPLTVLFIVAMVNAVNLIDGLDGLAAGVVTIAGVAFFVFAYSLAGEGVSEAVPTSWPILVPALVGAALGFLPYNFNPARIFMGDTGSMVLGLLLGAGGVSFIGRTTGGPAITDFTALAPLFIPLLVLAIPLMDTVLAVARRVKRHQPITMPDRGHLHHRLLEIGHSHRRAVLLLYYWSIIVAFGTVGTALLPLGVVVTVLVVAVVSGAVITARRPRTLEAPAEHETQTLERRPGA